MNAKNKIKRKSAVERRISHLDIRRRAALNRGDEKMALEIEALARQEAEARKAAEVESK